MESNRKRIRKDFAPLTIAASVECATPASPCTQVYNVAESVYEPDRNLTPTMLTPVVKADAQDGSWDKHDANPFLADMQWYIDGKKIEEVWVQGTDYTIDTSNGSSRGSLIIRRNVPAGIKHSLRFEGKVADIRLGVNVPFDTKNIIINTIEKGEDTYGLTFGKAQNIVYDPSLDKLHLYEYKVAQGIIAANSTLENQAKDGNSYLFDMPIELFLGKKKVTDGYTITLHRITSTGEEEVVIGDDELISMSNTSIALDLRLIDSATYMVRAFVSDKEVAKKQFSVGRVLRKYVIEPMNGADISPTAITRADHVTAMINGAVVDSPESIIRIVWFTETKAKTVEHNEGASTIYSLDKTGIGSTYADSWLETYVMTEYKDAYATAIDDNGDILTDENGNELIIN